MSPTDGMPVPIQLDISGTTPANRKKQQKTFLPLQWRTPTSISQRQVTFPRSLLAPKLLPEHRETPADADCPSDEGSNDRQVCPRGGGWRGGPMPHCPPTTQAARPEKHKQP